MNSLRRLLATALLSYGVFACAVSPVRADGGIVEGYLSRRTTGTGTDVYPATDTVKTPKGIQTSTAVVTTLSANAAVYTDGNKSLISGPSTTAFTLQGNNFNGANELVQTDSLGQIGNPLSYQVSLTTGTTGQLPTSRVADGTLPSAVALGYQPSLSTGTTGTLPTNRVADGTLSSGILLGYMVAADTGTTGFLPANRVAAGTLPANVVLGYLVALDTGTVGFLPANRIAAGSLGSSVVASSIAASAIGIAQLSATGTKDTTTFLRGDNTFVNPLPQSLATSSDPTFDGMTLVNNLSFNNIQQAGPRILINSQIAGFSTTNGETINVSGTGVSATGLSVTATSGSRNTAMTLSASGGSSFNRALVISAGDTLIQTLTASRPLKLDSSGIMTATQIDLSNASDVTGNLPAAQIAAGSLGSAVIASSCNATGVVAGSYTNANLTIGADGRISAASNGTAGGSGPGTFWFQRDGSSVDNAVSTINVVGADLTATSSPSGKVTVAISTNITRATDWDTINKIETAVGYDILTSTEGLTQSSATATYLQLSSATATYLQKTDAAATYLTQSGAASAYQAASNNLLGLAGVAATGPIYRNSNGSVSTNTIPTTDLSGTISTTQIANNSVDGTKIALGSDAQGDVMYYNGTDWVRLPAGTSGNFLKTNGTGANPSWAAAGGGPFTNATSSTSLSLDGHDITNVSTNSWITSLINGTSVYWNTLPTTSTATFVPVYGGSTITWVPSISDLIRTNGVAGSTNTMNSDLIMNTLTQSTLLALNSSKQIVSVSNTGANGSKFLRDDFTWQTPSGGSGGSVYVNAVATTNFSGGGYTETNVVINTTGTVTVGTMTVVSTFTVSGVDALNFNNTNINLNYNSHLVNSVGQNIDDRLKLYMSSTTTTTGGSLQTGQTTMSWAVKTGEVWNFRLKLACGCSSTGGVKFGLSAPGSSTLVSNLWGGGGSGTATAEAQLSAFSTASAAFCTTARQTATVEFFGQVTAGSSGTVQLVYQAGTAAQTATLYSSSQGTAERVQ